MASTHRRLLLILVGLVALVSHTAFASVLAIDYGSDWIKASLMKPGVPFDVLLNRDSKRKIQSSVAWKGEDRLFGGDAASIASRFPADSFSSLKLLQAAPYDSDAVSFYTAISTAEIFKTTRGTAGLRRKDGSEWSVEELIAMQLSYVKDLAESAGGEKVYDVVVVVPAFYTQPERDAVADAIEIAGLRTLALVNDGTAVAVNYAMTRTFPAPEYHVVFDAGASAVRATVVSFTTVQAEKGKGKDSTHIAVHGVGYDRSTGGTELDRRLRDLLADDFQRKHGRDLHEDKRGMARLWKETSRVKAILSANMDSRVTVESIAWDIDYKSKISRAEFEKACADLKPRFVKPILEALQRANVTLDQVTSVILSGGHSRTPMVQAALRALVGDAKVAANVNADEAAVLGAALHGAALSRQFKTKDIRVVDALVHDVAASYTAEGKREKVLTTAIFPRGSKYGAKKTMTFRRSDDFTLTLAYRSPPARGWTAPLFEARITNVAEALANLTELGASDPVVKATLALSESGFISVKEAFVVGEVKVDESLTDKLKGFFGKGSSSSESTTSTSTTSTSTSASATATEKDTKPAVKEEKIVLAIETKFLSTPPPMTVSEKRAARARLQAFDLKESAKHQREDTRNDLESYMYRVRDLLADDSVDAPFVKCSKPTEREKIDARLEETFTWLGDDGEAAETAALKEKHKALQNLEAPVIHRYREIEEFPKALNNSQMWNWSTRLFLTEARANLTAEDAAGLPSRHTTDELDALERALKEHESWLNVGVERQKTTAYNEDPAISTAEMKKRAEELSNQLHRLVKRKVPKVKKTKTSSVPAPSEAAEEAKAQSSPMPESTASPTETPATQSTSVKHEEL